MKSLQEMTEAAKHKHYIETLANEVRHTVDEVGPVYDDIYTRLNDAAEIKDYVPVFAWRRTRAIFMER